MERIVYIIDDTVFYTLNGDLHRINGPAIIHSNGDTSWWKNGRKHRKNGPAYSWISKHHRTLEWWVDGIYCHKETHNYTSHDHKYDHDIKKQIKG